MTYNIFNGGLYHIGEQTIKEKEQYNNERYSSIN